MSISFLLLLIYYATADNIRTGSSETVLNSTKIYKAVMARPTILATEILQAKRDAVMVTFKILLDNSNQELRNVPINSKLYFITKLRNCQG